MFLSLYLTVIACFTAMAATLPGIFLVLRGVALMSDAISHAILPGVVIMFLLVQRLDSAWLLIGATLAGLLLVIMTEGIVHSRRLKKEVAVGLIFPFFFSIGVILICQYARDVHLDADMVLLGDIVFTPFMTLSMGGINLGPYALWLMASLVLANALFLVLFYKELLAATFDPAFAQLQGLRPRLCYYLLMGLTCITAVAAFDVVGSIVVVALMIVPVATALLLSDSLEMVTRWAIIIGLLSGGGGYWFAHFFDVSIAGSIALVAGSLFAGAFIGAPSKGLCARFMHLYEVERRCAGAVLCRFLARKERKAARLETLSAELGWTAPYASKVTIWAHSRGLVEITDRLIVLR